jgi:hypothetical protein
MTAQDVVFLFDVVNTLVDNDRVQDDLRKHLERESGPENRDRYWAIFEQVRTETGTLRARSEGSCRLSTGEYHDRAHRRSRELRPARFDGPKGGTMKATEQLHDLGQSLWLDNITRELLTSGYAPSLHRRIFHRRTDIQSDDIRSRDPERQLL